MFAVIIPCKGCSKPKQRAEPALNTFRQTLLRRLQYPSCTGEQFSCSTAEIMSQRAKRL